MCSAQQALSFISSVREQELRFPAEFDWNGLCFAFISSPAVSVSFILLHKAACLPLIVLLLIACNSVLPIYKPGDK